MFHLPATRRREVIVDAGGVALSGALAVPAGAVGAVVFAHGSGSSRHSPRNLAVAELLEDAHLATLLFEEPGTLETVARLARDWFLEHLGG
ncbi:MAG TPA: hypothetical protein VJ986_11890 [Gaiellaceae bacterium]|nr:hypothetical protein [Gaiellaceae bacterium]